MIRTSQRSSTRHHEYSEVPLTERIYRRKPGFVRKYSRKTLLLNFVIFFLVGYFVHQKFISFFIGDNLTLQIPSASKEISKALTLNPARNFVDQELSNEEFARHFLHVARSRGRKSIISNCSVFKTSWDAEQICCSFKREDGKFSCIPSVVVLGSQKGGTTALHSYLMLHPNLAASRKKELHLYDIDMSYERATFFDLSKYFGTQKKEDLADKVHFETTPSYIMSPSACTRMAVTLPQSTKFLLILRNPVDRLWSELQMKARRVDNQEHFKDALFQCVPTIGQCFDKWANVRKSDVSKRLKETLSIKECIRSLNKSCRDIADLAKLDTLLKYMRRYSQSKSKDYIKTCLSQSWSNQKEFNNKCFTSRGFFKERTINLPKDLESEIKRVQEGCLAFPTLRRVLQQPQYRNTTINLSRKQNHCWLEFFIKECSFCTSTDDEKDCTEKCVEKNIPSYRKYSCSNPIWDKLTNDSPRSREPKCHGPNCGCFPSVPMPSDISKGYFFRGAYSVHLTNCFDYLSPERILIIYNSELRKKPTETMHKIIEFLGIPDLDYSQFSAADANDVFEKKYPTFDDITGWSANGTLSQSTHIHDDLKELLIKEYSQSVEELRSVIDVTPEFEEEFKYFT